MKFSCSKESLLKGINTIGHLALKTTSLPILNNILLKTEKNLLTLTTTNLEAGIHHEIGGKTEETGECLVPAKLLLELAPLLPNGTIELNTNNNNLTITGEKINTTLRTAPTAEFPTIPTIENSTNKITIQTTQLIEALNKTIFAIGRVDNRPQFGGVLFTVNEGNKQQLIIAATDGYRLSELSVSINKPNKSFKFIIPLTTAQEIRRILTQDEEQTNETVDLEATENQVNLTIGPTQIISRLIDGDYPDYQPLFPEKTLTQCEVGKNELTKAVKAASLFSRSGIFDVSLTASPDHNLEVFSENTGIGAHHNVVEAKVSGEKITMTINAKYFLEGLAAVPGEIVKIFMTGADRPILLKSNKEKEGEIKFRHLIVLIKQL
ncbi:DNA polymerase III subunit beta [Candidatus Uhrbacteria bacterium RIFCSPLOWO2_12_FULL_46_10]|uniref:Beta sliding clamp n=1 Tax=Candidatus Uhrbacteria bacterium RIFCSPLOWO2_01_FULL_47_25 TaxID=1802402 RepID=A0A1F7US73_9BACT|nr:MAG: polymerase III subunit beta protein [Parcubacteria group bacterium GW2011_GWA2_46_9]OGL59263.1 MAG: DNA polymerase III subunit beta [Candidatus Uhrbacteria bacterium RIFCSPHIGHO2_01_FULL_46_23]OGL68492.1 MAG: DNA polymerase III subunit beta [Candidatus Uhrbacteria bacterium RIFCSPHIGHO2_02_FULL_47_29]OGL75581.1 MAG: DNA polymerase III subunit beta [Candidatus Uhrbacteria bacterium RIFCSPHIGHO2_12_FULL_46_13]OGL81096.1 MAG: DNA polymerase III subunit beta [Candidatus Uhrbacteria bacteriu